MPYRPDQIAQSLSERKLGYQKIPYPAVDPLVPRSLQLAETHNVPRTLGAGITAAKCTSTGAHSEMLAPAPSEQIKNIGGKKRLQVRSALSRLSKFNHRPPSQPPSDLRSWSARRDIAFSARLLLSLYGPKEHPQ